jgi:hypothetical protein
VTSSSGFTGGSPGAAAAKGPQGAGGVADQGQAALEPPDPVPAAGGAGAQAVQDHGGGVAAGPAGDPAPGWVPAPVRNRPPTGVR